jgi:hypothetical protein
VGAEGDTLRAAFFPATAYNSQANEYLATWYGDGLATDDEFEVFARRLGTPQACSSITTQPPPPPGPEPPPDEDAPVAPNKVVKLSVTAASTQSALRAKAIVLRASCDEACTLTASARLSVPGASKTYSIKSVKRSLAANKRVTLKLKLSAKTIRAAKRALARRKNVRATVSLRARGAGGGQRKSTLRIRVKR